MTSVGNAFNLSKIGDDVFNISNNSGKSQLQVTLTGENTNFVNEHNATDFNNFVVKIQSTNEPLLLGTNLQGKSQGQVIDLRGVNETVKADFTVNREAATAIENKEIRKT